MMNNNKEYNKRLDEKLKKAFEEAEQREFRRIKGEVEKNGCQLSQKLFELNTIQADYIKVLKKNCILLEKELIKSQKARKTETILAWVFVSLAVAIFIMGLISTIYIIKR